jgi:hypothetical protein
MLSNRLVPLSVLPSLCAAKGGQNSAASTGWVNSASGVNENALTQAHGVEDSPDEAAPVDLSSPREKR